MPITSSGRTRVITDAHKTTGNLTLAQTIQVSSNIGMAKFSSRLSPEEQFEMLRDFGFGTPTGAEFPSESRGRLARPDKWQPMYTRASLAMGYEFGVTPVQLAAAYGAIANDGVLLTPTLVREIRSPPGDLLYRHHPEPVRQVVTPPVAAKLREYLQGGSGGRRNRRRSSAGELHLAGEDRYRRAVRERTLRARRVHRLVCRALFPADDPQLVVIVKIDNPQGKYYGGLTAAPVTRTMLQQALASRRVAIDRSRFADVDTAPVPEAQTSSTAATMARLVVSLALQRSESGSRSAVGTRGCGSSGTRGRPAAPSPGFSSHPARSGPSRVRPHLLRATRQRPAPRWWYGRTDLGSACSGARPRRSAEQRTRRRPGTSCFGCGQPQRGAGYGLHRCARITGRRPSLRGRCG